jgi:hypothetical protein
MRNDKPDAMDRALDEALAQYANVEPLAGIEQRILGRVRAEAAAPRLGFKRWALAAVAVVVVAIGTAVLWKRPAPSATVARQSIAPAPPAARTPSIPPQVRQGRTRRTRSTAPLPKRDQFPTPVPITREENALLALVTGSPTQARDALLDLQQKTADPIRIEEIKIEPLRSNHATEDTHDAAK